MQKPTVLYVDLAPIPEGLRELDRWVLWRYTQRRGGVWAKMPFTTEMRPASSTDAATWATYDAASDAFIFEEVDGLGVVLGGGLHGIDLDDCRDPATGELSELAQEVLSKVAGYAEVSPSGTGIKLFTRTNLDSSRTNHTLGVEAYTGNRYFTVTGHVLPGHSALPDDVQDVGWLVERVWGEGIGASIDDSERALAAYRAPLEDWDLDRVVQEVLPHLDPDCGYEEWLGVGAAMHHQGQGDPAWLAAWDQWSEGSPKYADGYCEEKWKSFSVARGGGVTSLASLLKRTKDARTQAARSDRDKTVTALLQVINDCTDARDLQDVVAPQVAMTAGLSVVEVEQLATAIQARLRGLGVRLPIATVRGWCRPRVPRGNASMPPWAEEWVYITEGDKFFNVSTKVEVTPQGFRAMFNRNMPMNAAGDRERADTAALDAWGMPVVTHKTYLPSAGPVFELFGTVWVNLYRPESVPAVPDELSAEEQAAVQVVESHVRTFLADEREQRLLMSWVAHNVQSPGVKVRWSPYIHGVPGDGKSFFSELVAVAMGGQNVRALNGSTLESNFTDWATGYALVAIEEMKQHGHNRYDVMNKLKPYVTNSTVDVHPKGRASYTAPNVTNYIVFSNYLDGAPVDEGDRRYMFVSSQLTSDQAAEMTRDGYFARLFGAVQSYPGAMRKWLLEYPLHEEFDANGRAPDTAVKRTVVELSKNDLELAAEDLIEEGTEGVCKEVISSAHLTRAIEARGLDRPATITVNNLMTRLGYRLAFDRPKKWRGSPCRVWVRKGLDWSGSRVMERLNQTSVVDDFMR